MLVVVDGVVATTAVWLFEGEDDPQPATTTAASTAIAAPPRSCFRNSISTHDDASRSRFFPGYARRVHFGELTPPEQRVLGCLIEKRWTTPDQYPLSLNALRLACNQSTNRDPVTHYDETTVRDAAQRLSRYGLARLASGHGSRSIKYRHLAEEALGIGREQLAVLAVLLLRGPQTPGELKQRSERLAPLATLADVERVLAELSERNYARRLTRRPGQKEDRFEQLMGAAGSTDDRSSDTEGWPDPSDSRGDIASLDRGDVPNDLEARIAALEAEIAQLRAQLAELQSRVASPSVTP